MGHVFSHNPQGDCQELTSPSLSHPGGWGTTFPNTSMFVCHFFSYRDGRWSQKTLRVLVAKLHRNCTNEISQNNFPSSCTFSFSFESILLGLRPPGWTFGIGQKYVPLSAYPSNQHHITSVLLLARSGIQRGCVPMTKVTDNINNPSRNVFCIQIQSSPIQTKQKPC